jgi:hypothetical protein
MGNGGRRAEPHWSMLYKNIQVLGYMLILGRYPVFTLNLMFVPGYLTTLGVIKRATIHQTTTYATGTPNSAQPAQFHPNAKNRLKLHQLPTTKVCFPYIMHAGRRRSEHAT